MCVENGAFKQTVHVQGLQSYHPLNVGLKRLFLTNEGFQLEEPAFKHAVLKLLLKRLLNLAVV